MSARPSRPRRPLRAVLLAVLLVTAGCAGLAADPGTPTVPATPAPVPTDDRTPAGPRTVAPGLTTAGVEDALALTSAHRAILDARSHTRRVVRTEHGPTGGVRGRFTALVRVDPAANRTYAVRTATGTAIVGPVFRNASRVERYAADGGVAFAVTAPDGTTRYPDFEPFGIPDPWRLFLLLSAFETRTAGTTVRNGTTLYRVRSTALTDPQTVAAAVDVDWTARVTDAELFALVDGEGLVREYRLRYGVSRRGSVHTVRLRVRHAGINTTTVAPPPWLDRAPGFNRTDGGRADADRTAAAG